MVFQNNLLAGASGVTGAQAPFDTTLIGNSVWLDGSSDQFEMAKTSGGSASSKFTVSCWIQRNEFTEGTFTGIFGHFFDSNTGVQLTWLNANTLTWVVFSSTSGSGGQVTSSELFRDIGWYHILGNYDGTNGKMELFVNGESVGVDTFTASSTNPIGSGTSGAAYYWGAVKNTQGTFGRTNSYLAQCALELGTAAVPSDYVDTFTFGTNGSQVIPKATSDLVARINSAGGHSHLLDFSNSSDLGNDASSNNNDFTATSMSSVNQTLHTPSLSYPVFNALCPRFTDGGTWSEGNTKIVATSESTNAITTLPPISTGKYYFQWVFTDNASSGNCAVGMTPISHWNGDYIDPFASGDIFYADHRNGNFRKGSTTVNSILSASGTYALCFDLDAGKVWVGLVDTSDGSISWYNSSGGTDGDPANGNNPTATFTANTSMVPFAVIGKAAGTSWTVDWNFGQFGFGNSAVPTEFEQITSAKITAPDFQGIDYFDATIYEGNGTGQRVGDFVPFTDIGTISQSVAFNLADSDKLTIASSVSTTPTNVQKKTISVWLKPWKVGENFIMVGVNGSESERIYTTSTGQLQYLTRDSGSTTAHVSTNGAFVADPSQWVHVVFGIDYTDGSTEADRVKIYVNGVQITDLANTNYPANNMQSEAYINKASTEQIIGKHPSTSGGDATNFSDMYYAEYYMIDGEQLDPSVFGQLDTSTNRWVAKSTSTVTSAINALTDGFGSCGFYLNFSNTSDYGEDSSGNNRDFTENGVLDATNQFTDAPSLNFPIIDIGTLKVSTGTLPLAKGGLQVGPKAGGGGGAYRTGTGFSIPEGSWIYKTTMPGKDANLIGVWTESGIAALDGGGSTKQTGFYGINMFNGELSHNKTETSASDAASIHGYTWASDISSTQAMNVLINRTGSVYKLWFVKDGATAAVGNPAAGTGAHIEFSSTEAVYAGIMVTATSHSLTFDFGASNNGSFTGNSNFSGYKLINQDNLDNTASKLTAWAWIKNRDDSDSHVLIDRVRGVGVEVHTDGTTTTPETTNTNTVQRFLQRGVQIGGDVQVNTANESYVLWQWLVGDSATTGTSIGAGSISTGVPSIASTVLAADAGHFSVVSYTGNTTAEQTVGHGMGGTPEFIIAIARAENGENKPIFHVDAVTSDTRHIKINQASMSTAGTTIWDVSAMSSTVFGLGAAAQSNSTNGMIAYCFRSVPGVCKIGSYVGNGSDDGPYVAVGFLPRWIFIKNYSADQNWMLWDTARSPYNQLNNNLWADLDSSESTSTTYARDILSDGFKLRGTHAIQNANSNNYLYIAMAEIGGGGTLPPIYGR